MTRWIVAGLAAAAAAIALGALALSRQQAPPDGRSAPHSASRPGGGGERPRRGPAASTPTPWRSRPPGTAATLPAGDWPMYRGGPGLTGAAAGQLPDSLRLAWTFKANGPVKSSPAIAQGRVFVGSDDGYVYAINLADGSRVWSFLTEGQVQSSPCVLEGVVFVGSSDYSVYALDGRTGGLVWKYDTGGQVLAGPNWFRAAGLRPGGAGAVAPATVPASRPQAPATSLASTAAAHLAQVRIVVGSYDFRVHCLDASTGQAVWTYDSDNYVNGACALAGGLVVFGGCDGKLHVVRASDGAKVRTVDLGSYVAASPALADGQALVGHYGGQFVCVDVPAGTVAWTYGDGQDAFFSSAAVGSGRAVVGCRDKNVHGLDAATGQRLWTFRTGGEVNNSPVLCGDRVVVGSDDGRLYLLDAGDGREVWSYELGQPVAGSPAVGGGCVVVGCDDGRVYAFTGR